MYVQLYVYEFIFNVYFELISPGQCLFVFDCHIMILQCSTEQITWPYLMLYELVTFLVDANITWTLPFPQHGPLSNTDISVRTTHKVLDGSSSELHLEWDFTLSGESLIRVSWKRGANDIIGDKTASGAVILLPAFQGQFSISPNDPATLVIHNTTAAEGKEITCTVITNLRNWNDVISVVIKGGCSFCSFTLSMYMYVSYSSRECAWFMLTVYRQVAVHLSGYEEENQIV